MVEIKKGIKEYDETEFDYYLFYFYRRTLTSEESK